LAPLLLLILSIPLLLQLVSTFFREKSREREKIIKTDEERRLRER
jgi:hypothetical protein